MLLPLVGYLDTPHPIRFVAVAKIQDCFPITNIDMNHFRTLLILIPTFCLFTSAASIPIAQGAGLTVGSKAPDLNIEHWLSDGGGKFKPLKEFQPGKIYVVEFWATWCGPCKACMPHLAELQKMHAEQGVQIISVSDEELETVQEFLGSDVPAGMLRSMQAANESTDPSLAPSTQGEPKAMTFQQLTSAYCLTTDPDQSTYKDYMEASAEGGIPTSFLVGKQGIIEWIGHPMEIDQPLADLIADRWDREAFLKSRNEKKFVEESLEEVYRLLEAEKYDQAMRNMDDLIKQTQASDMNMGLKMMKLELLIQLDASKAVRQFNEITAGLDSAETLNGIVWTIVELASNDQYEISNELIDAAVTATKKAIDLSPKDGTILDTLSHLHYLKKDLDSAIEVQTRAVELNPELGEMKEFLEKLKSEKKQSK
jgi:thiol-disulfide isomerase/thioredoxin